MSLFATDKRSVHYITTGRLKKSTITLQCTVCHKQEKMEFTALGKRKNTKCKWCGGQCIISGYNTVRNS